MPQTKSLYVVGQALVSLLKKNWESMGLPSPDNVYYGEQQRYPSFPAIAVDPGAATRELTQTGMQATITFNVAIIVYYGQLVGARDAREASDKLAQAVVDILDQDKKLGDLVIHSLVGSIEPGYAAVAGAIVRATRLSWTGFSKLQI